MIPFFRCVAESVIENGIQGLAGMVPGGAYIYAVAELAVKKYRERHRFAELRAEVVQMAQASFDQACSDAVEVAREVFTQHPSPSTTPDQQLDLELFLTAIPDAVRQSLKRPDDPKGITAPANFTVNTADDLVKLLPPRPPRFRPGADLPGKPGWKLERLLGIGGFGEVWYTRHAKMASLAGAVKFCLGKSGQDLIHEADLIDRVMAAGRHPNIVPLVDADLSGEMPWLLFEYISGGCLTDWIHQLAGRTNEQRVQQVLMALQQLTEAVGFFHELRVPIVHRDLKPSNILMDRVNKKLRITDFGIGSVTAGETLRQESRRQSTRGGRLLTYMHGSHTPLYASPQQRAGAEPDPRDDVHALGVIGYQMLTGHLSQGAGPDFADDLRDAGANEELIAILGKCVAQKAERRPRDARELQTGLKAVIRIDRGESAKPATVAPQRELSSPPLPISPGSDTYSPPATVRHVGERFEINIGSDVTMTFSWIPRGTFQMGGNEQEDNLPHRVTLTRGFYLGTTPVTQQQWKAILGHNRSQFQGDQRPVDSVSWDDCQSFCERMTRLTSRPIRLPTEAEWEYACRAGSTTEYWYGTGEAVLKKIGWFAGNSGRQTHPVGQLLANPWGLYDIHGNVWEWCADQYSELGTYDQIDPQGRFDGDSMVLRGGGWGNLASNCVASFRNWFVPGLRDDYFGLRVCFHSE